MYCNKIISMKSLTNPRNIAAIVAVTVAIVFAALAVIHIIGLTNQGLINWRY